MTPRQQDTQPRHWHLTRDIKPRGECPGCDLYWEHADRLREESEKKERGQ